MKVDVTWHGNMLFAVEGNNGRYAMMDASRSVGGQESAPSPKEVFLGGLAGCTGMDVVSILRKMRIEPETFTVRVEAELGEEHPRPFLSYELVYVFTGKGLEDAADKIKKAVDLSQQRYCGISATLEKTGPVKYSVKINP